MLAPPDGGKWISFFGSVWVVIDADMGKVVRHGRYITFQMAEFAISRPLFVEILRLMTGCGQPLCRHDSAPSSSIQITRQDRCVLRRRGPRSQRTK